MDIKQKIQQLKLEKNAVILAHYYANSEAQEIADYIGDSFYLAKAAKNTDADIILFCGVSFMGESAKILNPNKKVIMPDSSADCAMAHMADADTIKSMREKYDDLAVVCYINSTAELKCSSDLCVTSANAVKLVRALPQKNIFFIPDRNLGAYIAKQVPEKNIILNDGCCPIHDKMQKAELERLKQEHPDAIVMAHPECREDILALADFIGSTSAIISAAEKSNNPEFIICTEEGVRYELEKRAPGKAFYFASSGGLCGDMKLNTLKNIYNALKDETGVIDIDEQTRLKALAPLEKMLDMSQQVMA